MRYYYTAIHGKFSLPTFLFFLKMTTQSDTMKLPSSAAGTRITWSGSLVGSSNPNQTLGYTSSYSYSKRYKMNSGDTASASSLVPAGEGELNSSGEAFDLPSSIIIQFQNRQGETVGAPMDIPLDHSNVEDLSKHHKSPFSNPIPPLFKTYS